MGPLGWKASEFRATIVRVLLCLSWLAIGDSIHAQQEFTIVVLPDTQKYSRDNPQGFAALTQWVVNRKDALNVVFVTQVGDLVDAPAPTQLRRASNSMEALEKRQIPYGIALGNHDLDDDHTGQASTFRRYFPVSRWQQQPWWGGYYKQDDSTRNSSYQLFSIGPLDFIIIHLEWEAPDDVLQWAARILHAHPNHRALITTHFYLRPDTGKRHEDRGVYYDRNGLNTGEDMWRKLVSKHANVFMVNCGHWAGPIPESLLTSYNDAGKPVHQIMTDYSLGREDGWLRYYTFRPSENKIYAYTYNVLLNKFETDADSQFVLDYDMSRTPIPLSPSTRKK